MTHFGGRVSLEGLGHVGEGQGFPVWHRGVERFARDGGGKLEPASAGSPGVGFAPFHDPPSNSPPGPTRVDVEGADMRG